VYYYDGTGWKCIHHAGEHDLGNQTGSVSLTLYAGVNYLATRTGNITSYARTLSTSGTSSIRWTGSGYTHDEPSGTERKSTGYDDLAEAECEEIITRTGTVYTGSASERVTLA